VQLANMQEGPIRSAPQLRSAVLNQPCFRNGSEADGRIDRGSLTVTVCEIIRHLRACRPYATPSSNSSFDHDLSDARTAEDKSTKSNGVNKSAKVVLGPVLN